MAVTTSITELRSATRGGCHLLAEQTVLEPAALRLKCGIDRIVLPDHLYADATYTKWGDVVLESGRRLPGELFWDESVQTVLTAGGMLGRYDVAVRYPRTYHLPYSRGITSSDRVLKDTKCFEGRDVVVSLKMDGENTSLYRDRLHARSVDGSSHVSQSYARGLHARIAHDIPLGWRVIAENLYAVHSIRYDNLTDYLYVISIWDDKQRCLLWSETCEIATILGLPTVPVIYDGPFDQAAIAEAYAPLAAANEGFVVRLKDGLSSREFRSSVGKWVRLNHVAATVHNWRTGWYESESTVNRLARTSTTT